MPLSAYEQALAGLDATLRSAVEAAFDAWLADAGLGQVFRNVSGETALAIVDFTSLLNSFAAELAKGNSNTDSWLTACRAHKRKGRCIPVAVCPLVLGRAKGLEDHAASIERTSSGAFTKEEAKKLLIKYSGKLNVFGFDSFLRETPLGKYNLVWATFDAADTKANPFNRLPSSRVGICTALGLGGLTDTLILLVWNHTNSGSPPIHRPTIADAEVYPYYRPNPNTTAQWGLTEPLLPNPTNLRSQPEVVMTDPTCKGLLLPFQVAHI